MDTLGHMQLGAAYLELLVGAALVAASSAMRMVSMTSRVCGLSSWGARAGPKPDGYLAVCAASTAQPGLLNPPDAPAQCRAGRPQLTHCRCWRPLCIGLQSLPQGSGSSAVALYPRRWHSGGQTGRGSAASWVGWVAISPRPQRQKHYKVEYGVLAIHTRCFVGSG